MEHRCGYRRAARLRVIVRGLHGAAAEGVVRDISASGAFIASSLPVRASAQIFVQFEYLQQFSRTRRAVAAEVVRCESNGFAIEWEDFSPPAVRALLRQLSHEYERDDVAPVAVGQSHSRAG
jgi:hypothetical protein